MSKYEYDEEHFKKPSHYVTPRFANYDAWKLASPDDYIDYDVCVECGAYGAKEDLDYRCQVCNELIEERRQLAKEEEDRAELEWAMTEGVELTDFDNWDESLKNEEMNSNVSDRNTRKTVEVPVIIDKPIKDTY